VNRRRLSHGERQEAAEGLLEFGNGVTYCEPHCGTFTMTELSMAKVDEIISEKKELDLEVKSLTEKVETQGRQSAELCQTCKLLEEECKNVKGRCEQKKERSSVLQAAISHDLVS